MPQKYNAKPMHSMKQSARQLHLDRSLALLALLLVAALLISGCAKPGSGSTVTPVQISTNCENIAQPVPHYPVVKGKTDARVAYRGEYGRLSEANRRIVTSNDCQAAQRIGYGSPFPIPRR